MSSGITWSLKGINPETREAVKAAARQSGLTLGEWLNIFILQAVGHGKEGGALGQGAPGQDVLSQKTKKSKSKASKKAARKKSRKKSLNPDKMSAGQKALASIGLRLAASEKHAIDAVRSVAIQAVHSRLDNFDEKISGIRQDKIRVSSQDSQRDSQNDHQAIENTLQKIVARLENSENQNSESSTAGTDAADAMNLEDRVSELARRIGAQPG